MAGRVPGQIQREDFTADDTADGINEERLKSNRQNSISYKSIASSFDSTSLCLALSQRLTCVHTNTKQSFLSICPVYLPLIQSEIISNMICGYQMLNYGCSVVSLHDSLVVYCFAFSFFIIFINVFLLSI